MKSPLVRAKKLNKVVSILTEYFENNGYSEVQLPIYEFYDLLEGVTWDFKDENIIRFIDRYTGKSLVLRPDFTPQACRFVSLYMKDYPLPIRISYKGRIFRNVDLNKGLKSEKYQVGCELFGVKEFLGDIEIIYLAYNSLKQLGLKDYKIVIGDSYLVKEIVKSFGNDQSIIKCLKEKNLDKLKKLYADKVLHEDEYNMLFSMIKGFGEKAVLDELILDATFSNGIRQRLIYLRDLIERLFDIGIPEKDIVFDATEMRGFNYYTGVNFDIIKSDGTVIGGGGRYDNLMDKFNWPLQSCGFALNIEEIIQDIEVLDDKQHYDYLLIGEANFFQSLKLKSEGYKVLWVKDESEVSKIEHYFCFEKIIK
ncbi:ATP phosphoribosyltransferase regulatory subunit [Deferribacter desulfuricans SSM1]|uniref:ATP phosphoribosyltransferase regulatory subunit n=1 Tax=Deferribacter desulfuricans (strain DSM 14783 / JCM 11476 / NBRC 101012 / SSM1) TaxID=639282 RepID=D3PA30_DEFDS|nr:ATP phosphoribosyltransferase regulatory subunit [Deferribacter desulfuricans]BAI81570.1 ATP phosphoribosyltransferase regulatory subunit [Deferribacter desulfuricans SSM1]